MNKKIRNRILPVLMVLSVTVSSPMVAFASERGISVETASVQVTVSQDTTSQQESVITDQTTSSAESETTDQKTPSSVQETETTASAPAATAKETVTQTNAKSSNTVSTNKTTSKTTTTTKTTTKTTTAKKTTKATTKATAAKKTSTAKKAAKKPAYTQSELRLMSAIIFCEAGAESYTGKVAVGIVVMNRVRSKLFPNTIKKVIYQRGQFSPVRNGMLSKALKLYDKGKFKQKNHLDSIKAAKEVLNGRTTVTIKGKKVSMKSYLFFSVYLKHRRLKIGHHMFR